MLDSTCYLPNDATAWCTNDERRAALRHAASVQVRFVLVSAAGERTVLTGKVINLSHYGMGLIVSQALGQGRLLEVELKRKNGTFVRNLLARVVHEVRESSQAYVIGCAFIRELETDCLQFFQADAVHPAGPDCRRWTRFPCNVETVCYTSDTAPGERRSGRILNISAGGVGLQLRCEFSEGTLLHFELPAEMNLANQKVLVRVARLMEQPDGSWFLGCEFADELTVDELKALLR